MKKSRCSMVLGWILLMGMLLFPITIAGAETEGDYTYEVADGEATITRYRGENRNLVIPQTLGGYPVTEIGMRAFSGAEFESVVIPEGVKYIGLSAFSGCTRITSLQIPGSVTELGTSAFEECSALRELVFSEGLQIIGRRAFSGCEALSEIQLPEGLKSIGDSAFELCRFLSTVQLPESLQSIGSFAFASCRRSLRTITIPKNVTLLGDALWYNCERLEEILVDAENPNYTAEGGVLFDKEKKTLLAFPQNLWEDYVVPVGVEEIAAYAFAGFSGESVTLPESLQVIGEFAFADSTDLITVEIPAQVSQIGKAAFGGCESLTSIAVAKENPYYTSVDGNLYTKDKTELLQYAAGKPAEQYQVPAGVTIIGRGAFYACNSLKKIRLPFGVTTIREDAFYRSTALETVQLPESLTELEKGAFYDAYIQYITIPGSVGTLKAGVFEDCDRLTAVILAEGMTAVERDAFLDSQNLSKVVIPRSMTKIAEGAFVSYWMNDLETIYYCGTQTEWEATSFCRNYDLPASALKYEYDGSRVKAELVSCSQNGWRVSVTLAVSDLCVPNQFALVALYDEQDCLAAVQQYTLSAERSEQIQMYLWDEASIKYAKVFFWEGSFEPTPVAQALYKGVEENAGNVW